MPISGTMAVSLPPWQSQQGEMLLATLMWKCGRPCSTAAAYSAMRALRMSLAASMGLESMTKRVRIKCGRCKTVNVAVFDAKGET